MAIAVGVFRDRSPRGTALVVAGSLLVAVAVGVGWGNLAGEDPEWFAVLGVPGNLLMLPGSVLVARRVLHEGRGGIGLALLLAAYVPLSLAAGGGLVAAALWAAIAAGAAASKDEPSTVSRPLPAR